MQPPRLFPAAPGVAPSSPGLSALDLAAGMAAAGAPQRAHVDSASNLVAALPPPLLEAVREPFTARAVVYALLLDSDPEVRRLQLAHLEAEAERGTSAEVVKLVPVIAPVGAAARLPLVELALPALRQLSGPQYQQFRNTVEFLVASDRKLSLFEFALQRMLRRHLDPQFRQRRPDAGPVRGGWVRSPIIWPSCSRRWPTRAMPRARGRRGRSRREWGGSASTETPPRCSRVRRARWRAWTGRSTGSPPRRRR